MLSVLAIATHAGAAHAAATCQPDNGASTSGFDRIEAARSGWDAPAPPLTGWTPVTLPDVWAGRWPGFDGVVWYRLSWRQSGAARPCAILLDYLNMAGAVYLNGSLLSRDTNLTEPLSRAWNTPRIWIVDSPVLRDGGNTLLIRVSGLAAYSPGLGNVVRGDPAPVMAQYRHAVLLRQDLQFFGLAITVTLGGVFLALWIMRRQESAYGWFAAMSIAWWCYAYNQIAISPWPFATTHAWEKFSSIAFLFYCASFMVFVLRFCRRRAPRAERALWAIVLIGSGWLIVTPGSAIADARALWALIPMAGFIVSCGLLLWFSWRSREIEQQILTVCMVIFIAVGVHDLLVFVGILNTNIYYAVFTSQALMLSMALALAWRFAQNVRKIEQFNDELRSRVDLATQELAHTLTRQHTLEVANARLGERLNLAHDLHDGLGGTLVSSIAALEHSPADISSDRFLSILKELRDDLRIVIDAAAHSTEDSASLAEQIGPLRHRMTRIFENRQIECSWLIDGADPCNLSAAQVLDITRILQEALTNVLKHSRARRVQIVLRTTKNAFELRVTDDGVGFETHGQSGSHYSTGLRSMAHRAARLGATFEVSSASGSTHVVVVKPDVEAANPPPPP